jgi:hypothetical protein
LGSSAPTPSEWLSRVAARLGVAEPAAALGPEVARGLPAGADGWDAPPPNALLPGAVPLEVSFSEAAPAALRFDFEPLGWRPVDGDVRGVATRAVRRAAAERWGPTVGDAFAARAHAAAAVAQGGFGAFAGAVVDRDGLREAKVYYPAAGAPVPGPTAPLVAAARSELHGLEGLMHAVAARDAGVAERAYLVCRSQLDLLALEPLLARLGLAHRAPELIVVLARVTGGASALAPGSAIIGLRPSRAGTELKVELPLAGLGLERPLATLASLLAERPRSHAAFRRWLAAVALPGLGVEPSVVSARVTAARGVRLSAYVHVAAGPAAGGGEPAGAPRVAHLG